MHPSPAYRQAGSPFPLEGEGRRGGRFMMSEEEKRVLLGNEIIARGL